ncbi:MAG: PPC domain-containing DNA-binding protein [Candidatus Diapherotrites archaeon]
MAEKVCGRAEDSTSKENTFVVKINDGTDIFERLNKLAKDKDIEYGMILNGCGAVREFELISSGPKASMEKLRSKDAFQINAMSGKIQKKSGEYDVTVRASITKSGFTPRSGQLTYGRASGTLEVGVRKIAVRKIIEA